MTVCAFVDSIDVSPGVGFDCNDGTFVRLQRDQTTIGMPDLRVGVAQNMLSDGGVLGSSAYGFRRIVLGLLVQAAVQDDAFAVLSGLFRELDKPGNLLMWQDEDATYPVFFETLRSAPDAVDVSLQGAGVWRVRVEVLAQPFALGLMETVTIGTVSNDPASGCYFDVNGVKGDVDTPAILAASVASPAASLLRCAVRRRGVPADFLYHYTQAEAGGSAVSPGLDTTNPGGAADSAMSGAGTTNYLRTSFSTPASSVRISVFAPGMGVTLAQNAALKGTYRVIAFVRRSDATSVMTARVGRASFLGDEVAIPLSTARQALDLGLLTIGNAAGMTPIAYQSTTTLLLPSVPIQIYAGRTSGSGTLDWDGIFLLPADDWQFAATQQTATDASIFDALKAMFYRSNGANSSLVFSGTGFLVDHALGFSGGFPVLSPGANRIYTLISAQTGASAITHSLTDVAVRYFPRYLHVRAAGT